MDGRTPTSPRSVHASGSSSRQIAYHDGLIPSEHQHHHQASSLRHSANYPEVIPSGRETPEKSYPELATSPPLEKNYPEVATSEHQHHRHQLQQNGGPSPVPTPSHTPAPTAPTPAPTIPLGEQTAFPRPSGVHSLGDAWSEAGDDVERETRIFPYHPPDQRKRSARPLWKRKTFWVILALSAIIVVLAAVVGAMASGKIRTGSSSAAEDPNRPSTLELSISTAPSGQTITLSCPSASNHNYTVTPLSGQEKVFRRQCGANYPEGDGSLGKLPSSETISSLTECLDRCAEEAKCVGAVFNSRAAPNPECWLKEFLGVRSQMDGAETGVLWQ